MKTRNGLHHFRWVLAAVFPYLISCSLDPSIQKLEGIGPEIRSPKPGEVFSVADTIPLEGLAWDQVGGGLLDGQSLVWSYGAEVIGTGKTANAGPLPEGNPVQIKLRADFPDGEAKEATVNVVVTNDPPIPVITNPEPDDVFNWGEEVLFQGSATDSEDEKLTGNDTIPASELVWSSSKDGDFAVGDSLRWDNLSEGEHTITLQATDSHGKIGTATVSITIDGQEPEPVILQPDPEKNHRFGRSETINFRGRATDPEQGDLEDEDLEWFLGTESLGNGSELSKSAGELAPGEEAEEEVTVILRATDASGKTGEAQVIFTVYDDGEGLGA